VHGIDRDHGAGQPKRAEQALHGWDLVGLVVAVEVRQHQGGIGREGAEHVRGAPVVEVVEAVPQGFAVNGHVALALKPGRVVQGGGVAAECRLDRGGVELLQDTADRRVGWRFPPPHAKRIAQPGEVNIDEAVDRR
jgi:hypothetical protein